MFMDPDKKCTLNPVVMISPPNLGLNSEHPHQYIAGHLPFPLAGLPLWETGEQEVTLQVPGIIISLNPHHRLSFFICKVEKYLLYYSCCWD